MWKDSWCRAQLGLVLLEIQLGGPSSLAGSRDATITGQRRNLSPDLDKR
jgi:hypothetical protein